jgi:hypothetical protein
VTRGSFSAFFMENFDRDYPIVFEKAGANVGFGPQAMVYWDKKKKNYKVIYKADIHPQVDISENQIVYKNIYPGVDMQFFYLANSLREYTVLSEPARNSLPEPKKYGIKDKDAWLMFLYRIDLSGSMPASVAEEKIGKGKKKKEIETYKPFKFKNIKGETMFTLSADYAFVDDLDIDITKNGGTARMYNRIFKENEDYFMLSGISYKELVKMPKGPIVFDPDVRANEGNGGDAAICSYDKNAIPNTSFNWGGSSKLFVETTSGYAYRTLMRFDLGELSGTVLDATLKLYQTRAIYNAGYVNAYKVTKEWREGTSWGQQNSSSIDGVSWWERWYGDNLWTNTYPDWDNPGGDFDTTTLVGSALCNTENSFREFALDKWTVQDWVNDPDSNNGFILTTKTDIEGGEYYRIWFASSQNTTLENVPKLEINFSGGTECVNCEEEVEKLAPGTTLYIRGADGNVIATYKSDNSNTGN